MEIIEIPISKDHLKDLAVDFYGYMVKAVVDVNRGIMAVNAELHSDLEKTLLEDGSLQDSLWGINLYPENDAEDLIEYDSIINIRPRNHNFSRDVENPKVRSQISTIVWNLVK